MTNATFENANLNRVNFTEAIVYDVDVKGASMEQLNLMNAEIYNTNIGVGGE